MAHRSRIEFSPSRDTDCSSAGGRSSLLTISVHSPPAAELLHVRRTLAEEGVVTIVCIVDADTGKVTEDPDYLVHGFPPDAVDFSGATPAVQKALTRAASDGIEDLEQIEDLVRRAELGAPRAPAQPARHPSHPRRPTPGPRGTRAPGRTGPVANGDPA